MKLTILALSILLVTYTGCSLSPVQGQDALAVGNSSNSGTFTLTDHTGRTVTDQDFRGSYLLIFFGYTHCPDICPTALTVVANVINLLGEQAQQVQPVFITLDPERDTPQALANFVSYFHPRLIGLTGSLDQIDAVAKTYFVRSQKYLPSAPSDTTVSEEDNNYLLDHTAASYLLNTDGSGLALFQHGTPATEIAKTIQSFIDQHTLPE